MRVKIFIVVIFSLFWLTFGCLDLKIENVSHIDKSKRHLKCLCTKRNSTGGSEHIHAIEGNYHKYIGNKEAIVDLTDENRKKKTYQCVFWNSDKENRFAVLSDEIKLMEEDSQPTGNKNKVFFDMALNWFANNHTKTRIDVGDVGTFQCVVPYQTPPEIELSIYQRIGSRINVIQTCKRTPCLVSKKIQKNDINSILYCLYYPKERNDENSYYSKTYKIDEAIWNINSGNLDRSSAKATLYKIGIFGSILFLFIIGVLIFYKIHRNKKHQILNQKPSSNPQSNETVLYAEIDVSQTNNNIVINNNQTPYAQIVGFLKPKN